MVRHDGIWRGARCEVGTRDQQGSHSQERPKPRTRSLRWLRGPVIALLVLAAMLGWVRLRYGGGEPFPDRSGEPSLPESAIEVVAELAAPPGNIAVSATGRVFFTFHPSASPSIKLAELVDGRPVPYPNSSFQDERADGPWLDTPLGLRIDRQNRLWVLDNADHGRGDAKLLAFDLKSNRLVREHHFSSATAPLGSHLNDLAVHPDGKRIYIAEASILRLSPALIVYDVQQSRARRVLEGHPSVAAEPYIMTVDGEPMTVARLFSLRPGVDSIALDRQGEWLYFAAVTATKLYRLRTTDLDDATLSDAELGERVEVVGDKTVSDGITTDDTGTVYLTDPEHNGVMTLTAKGELTTLLKDPRLRWPDGFSFGPDGWLYVTCSALQHVILKSAEHTAAHSPYHILRFKPGASAPAGH